MANLVLLKSGESTVYEIAADEVVVGRHPECAVHVDSNMVSRKHARVVREGSDFFIEDLGSGNGTSVNGQKIVGRSPLNHEDRIRLGPILFRFENPAATSPPRPAPVVPTAPTLNVDVFSEKEDDPTIMGALESTGRFGALDVRPEAKLKAVLEISRSLAGTLDLDAVLPRILDTLFTIFPGADRGCVLLKQPGGMMVPRAIKHRREGDDDSVKLSRTILNKVLHDKTGILSADAANDDRFQASESISNFTIRSMMCVPLLALDNEPMGVINIDTQNPLKQFQQEDLEVLMAVAGQASLSYETARLAASYAEKQKQDNEMKIAAGVQHALLPQTLPVVTGYEFFASYESAQAVGGDYYDCFLLDEGRRVCLAFGDVAGKGVPASLVMSRLSSVVQTTLEYVRDAGEAAHKINRHMCANAIEGRFVTFTLTLIDLATHELSLVIAGHMSPMVRRADGSVEEFPEDKVGLPIGVYDGFEFETCRRILQPGETVVIYTDGVSEAMNPAGDLFGVPHLSNLVAKGPADAAKLGKLILADVKRHANGRPQNDDITLMAFGRKPHAPENLKDTDHGA